jgi:NADPH-dependent 2,4-dienoyl-CoA reductase/sulfur reductase-like enzyme
VIGTGAVPVRPPIDGLDLPGVRVLHTMGDAFALHQALTAGAGSAIIVGGGYIGLEMAEAVTARGLSATLVEQAPAVMPTVDQALGELLGQELGRNDVQTGVRGALRVDRHMRTNLPDILAAGDCVETWHRLLQQPTSTCRWARPPTSKAASPARPRSAARRSSPARWAPRWLRCSSWPWPAPAFVTRMPPWPAWIRLPSGRSSSTTRPASRLA